MTDRDSSYTQPGAPPEASLLEGLFRAVSSVVPEEQELITVAADTSVAEAVGLMLKHNCSQLPVILNEAVLGMFSFRSLVSELARNPNMRANCTDFPVNLFVEKWRSVQPSERWELILESLNRDNGVLVQWADQRRSIVTATDVVQFLTDITRSFMLLAEIELAIRRLIRACIPSEQLDVCIRIALGGKYSPERMPKSLEEMEFSDYTLFLGDTQNWTFFSAAFGDGDVLRKDTVDRLDQVRALRNDVFHFRRRLTSHEEQKLAEHREWLHVRMRLAESQAATKKPILWNQGSFLRALQGSCGKSAVKLAKELLEWARTRGLKVKAGEGKTVGSLHVRLKHQDRIHPLFSIWSSGYVQVQFWRYASLPPFESADERRELLARLNAIEGITLPQDVVDREPAIHHAVLTEETARQELLNVFEWVEERIRST